MSLILSLDTTAKHCAVALSRDDAVLACHREEMSKGQAERLFPMIEESLAATGVRPSDLDAIAVATGPGNFTGVRICVSAARGLALSCSIPALGVSVLEALAFGRDGVVTATLDARGGRIYAQSFADGTALGAPILCDAEGAAFDGEVLGFLTGTPLPGPEIYARVARMRDWTDAPRPSPLYLRDADAALPREPAPTIIP